MYSLTASSFSSSCLPWLPFTLLNFRLSADPRPISGFDCNLPRDATRAIPWSCPVYLLQPMKSTSLHLVFANFRVVQLNLAFCALFMSPRAASISSTPSSSAMTHQQDTTPSMLGKRMRSDSSFEQTLQDSKTSGHPIASSVRNTPATKLHKMSRLPACCKWQPHPQ
jgi:hypothetical protein